MACLNRIGPKIFYWKRSKNKFINEAKQHNSCNTENNELYLKVLSIRSISEIIIKHIGQKIKIRYNLICILLLHKKSISHTLFRNIYIKYFGILLRDKEASTKTGRKEEQVKPQRQALK